MHRAKYKSKLGFMRAHDVDRLVRVGKPETGMP